MSETSYQACHRHFGRLKHETEVARNLLQRHGAPTPDTVKELRQETDMPMAECAEMLRCMWRDIELAKLKTENAKLRMRNTTLRELAETFGMIANDRVLDYFERDEMLEAANVAARELGLDI